MRYSLSWAICSILAVPAAAQVGPAPTDRDITISARPLPPEDATRLQARAVAGNPTWNSPVPRVAAPVCLGVAGMRRAAAVAVFERITGIAESVGLERGAPGCTPTMFVLLVDQPGRDIARLRHRKPWLFRGMSRYLLDTAVREQGPVRAWNIVQSYTRDGIPIPDVRVGWANWDVNDPLGTATVIGGAPSRLDASTRSDIAASVVLIRRDAVAGLTTDQLAAYAAMRGLAIARPAAALAVPSILTLFDRDAVRPAGLTAFDRGFLTGLYQGIPNRTGYQRVGLMNRAIRQELRDDGRGTLN